jgi:hypothetical protein
VAAEGGADAGGFVGGSFAGLTCSALRKSMNGARLFPSRRMQAGISSLFKIACCTGLGSQGKAICTPFFNNSLGLNHYSPKYRACRGILKSLVRSGNIGR